MPKVSDAMKKYWDASEFYLKNLEATGRSQQTIKNYARTIQLFQEFWESSHEGSHHIIQDPGVTDIQEWRDEMLRRGLSPTTVQQYMVELRGMFTATSDESLGENRFYDFNPVARRLFPNVKKEKSRPYRQILTDEEVSLLWRNNRVGHHNYVWERNYAIIILLLSTAIRNDELRSLRLSDLDFENQEIVIENGKGSKYRVIDFPEIAQSAVKIYLESGYRPSNLSDDDLLFGVSKNASAQNIEKGESEWRKPTSRWLELLVSRHVQNVTGVSGVGPHDLRHVGARLDLNNGTSMLELQSKLGHTSPRITQIYSGRLQPSRRRRTAKMAYEERDRQTARNELYLKDAKERSVHNV